MPTRPDYTAQSAAAYKANIDATIDDLMDNTDKYIASGGAADAYTLTLPTAITAYIAGQRFSFLPTANNTGGACTLNIDGLGVKSIKTPINAGFALADPYIKSINTVNIAEVMYDGTQFILFNPAAYLALVEDSLVVGVTTGTSRTLTSAIPTWARKVHISFRSISTDGTQRIRMLLNSATSGYIGTSSKLTSSVATSSFTNSIAVTQDTVAANTYHGNIFLFKNHDTSDIWSYDGKISSNTAGMHLCAGSVDLAADLASIQITMDGADAFDGAGLARVNWSN